MAIESVLLPKVCKVFIGPRKRNDMTFFDKNMTFFDLAALPGHIVLSACKSEKLKNRP